jgi:Trk-type K+ transport system membrane component
MMDNLGLTLMPNIRISFHDATWPLLIMSSLAYAGNTFYPVFLRLLMWLVYKIAPAISSLKESLRFLLDHPRRCYILLFPSTITWVKIATQHAKKHTLNAHRFWQAFYSPSAP